MVCIPQARPGGEGWEGLGRGYWLTVKVAV